MYEGSIELQVSSADRWAAMNVIGRWETDAAEEMYLDTALNIGNKIFGNQGVQIHYNNGAPRFYVGDGSNKFVKFDGTDATLQINTIVIDGVNEKIYSTNYVTGPAGAGFYLDQNLLEVGNIACRGIMRTAVFQKDVVSAISGDLQISHSADVLASDMTALDSATLTIEGNVSFAVGDILLIKDNTDEEWLEVTNIGSAPTYSVTRDKKALYGADSNPTWTKGATVVNYGQSGDGGIILTASNTNAPYLSVYSHSGSPWTDLTTFVRIGNLNGFLGYSSDIYGVAIGNGDNYIKIDPTNGLIMSTDRADAIIVKSGGDITLESHASNPGELVFEGTSYSVIFGDYNGAGGTFRINPDTDNALTMNIGTESYRYSNLSLYGDAVNLYSRQSANCYSHVQVYSNGSTHATVVFTLRQSSVSKSIQMLYDSTYLHMVPSGHKDWNLGESDAAWDDAYADDWNNVADFFYLDSRDDLAQLHLIKGSGKVDPRTGLELIDDSTLPEWLLSKDKKGEEILRDPDGKPYLSLKLVDSLLMGAVRQLDKKYENHLKEMHNGSN